MFTLIRYTLHRLDNGTPPSKPRGLAVTMARLAGKLQDASGPFIIREGLDTGPDRSLSEMLRIVRKRMRRGEVGTRLLIETQSGPTWAIRKIQVHPKITDTVGNDRIDLVWTMTLKHFPGLANLGITVCKYIAGTTTWSQHSYGNAVDFGAADQAKLHEVADWIVAQTKDGGYFAGIVEHVIEADRVWTLGEGWHAYTGIFHAHVHVDCHPQYEGTPPCA